MPTFDLRNILVGKYTAKNNICTYSDVQKVGDAISVDMSLAFAEGNLYAEGCLAEYIKLVTGGSISIGAKYIMAAAAQLMYGTKNKTRTVNGKPIVSSVTSAKDAPSYVGVGFYAPDMVDGVQKYTAMFASRAMFSAPDIKIKTKGGSIEFVTPTTVGKFLPEDTPEQQLMDCAICDSAADAIAWVQTCFGMEQCKAPTATPAAGEVAANTKITLACAEADTTIYYTLDGSDPMSGARIYGIDNQPAIMLPCTLKAVATKDAKMNSPVLEQAYTLTK